DPLSSGENGNGLVDPRVSPVEVVCDPHARSAVLFCLENARDHSRLVRTNHTRLLMETVEGLLKILQSTPEVPLPLDPHPLDTAQGRHQLRKLVLSSASHTPLTDIRFRRMLRPVVQARDLGEVHTSGNGKLPPRETCRLPDLTQAGAEHFSRPTYLFRHGSGQNAS